MHKPNALPDIQQRTYPPERFEPEFSPWMQHPDRQETVDRHAEHGAKLYATSRPIVDVRYADGPLQTMDIFPGRVPHSPVYVIIHGGYWRSSDKRFVSFIAKPLIDFGAAVFVINYDLCPDVRLSRIVEEVREAVVWVSENAAAYNADPQRVCILGHSAGAHLGAMLLVEDWDGGGGFDPAMIRGALLLSGVYELRSLPQLPINAQLRLTAEEAVENCPLLRIMRQSAKYVIGAATEETGEFIQQSRDFTRVVEASGAPVDFDLEQGVGHFSILDRFCDPCSDLVARAQGLLEL